MRMRNVGLLAAGAVAALGIAACGGSNNAGTSSSSTSSASATSSAAASGKVGVILPDTASSVRWETVDRPFLGDAFKAAGVEYDIQNAQNDKAKFVTIAEGMISSGVKVLMITNLDSDTGATVIKKATDAGIPVIDYDRLTLGGGAKYYVSFDNVKVGTVIGEGLVACMQADGHKTGGVVELNGSPTDNNATLFKQGYDKVIRSAGYTVVADQSVPEWNNTTAGTKFEQIFTQQKGKFVGVASANDGLGGAVASVLARNQLAGKIPLTGQDATDEGLQRLLLGTQCVTVYKAVKKEADAASQLAIALIKGDTAAADALATAKAHDPTANKDVPSVLLDPLSVTKANVKAVIDDGYTTAAKVCTTPELKAACTKAGIS